jgi:hypothetical protein
MKTIIHVNMHVIRSNLKTGAREPVLTVKTKKKNTYAHEVIIHGPSRVVYTPDKPLPCGARVYILVEDGVEVELIGESECPQENKEQEVCNANCPV